MCHFFLGTFAHTSRGGSAPAALGRARIVRTPAFASSYRPQDMGLATEYGDTLSRKMPSWRSG